MEVVANPYQVPAERVEIGSVYFWAKEIGEHTHPEMQAKREIGMGFGQLFGFADLTKVRFRELANRVERVYREEKGDADCRRLAEDSVWLLQRRVLAFWVQRGADGIYALSRDIPDDEREEKYIWVFRYGDGREVLRQGSHRCLALWILGHRKVWAKVSLK